ncbi:MAG: hypothetical protein HZB39_18150 [Planctomycetes bacterium]|nr:hypothetical protein [Planctomycetota bacterium]
MNVPTTKECSPLAGLRRGATLSCASTWYSIVATAFWPGIAAEYSFGFAVGVIATEVNDPPFTRQFIDTDEIGLLLVTVAVTA